MLFVCHPKVCISSVFSFSWELKWPQEKLKIMLIQNFGVTNKEHYGMFCFFLYWSMSEYRQTTTTTTKRAVAIIYKLCYGLSQLCNSARLETVTGLHNSTPDKLSMKDPCAPKKKCYYIRKNPLHQNLNYSPLRKQLTQTTAILSFITECGSA